MGASCELPQRPTAPTAPHPLPAAATHLPPVVPPAQRQQRHQQAQGGRLRLGAVRPRGQEALEAALGAVKQGVPLGQGQQQAVQAAVGVEGALCRRAEGWRGEGMRSSQGRGGKGAAGGTTAAWPRQAVRTPETAHPSLQHRQCRSERHAAHPRLPPRCRTAGPHTCSSTWAAPSARPRAPGQAPPLGTAAAARRAGAAAPCGGGEGRGFGEGFLSRVGNMWAATLAEPRPDAHAHASTPQPSRRRLPPQPPPHLSKCSRVR